MKGDKIRLYVGWMSYCDDERTTCNTPLLAVRIIKVLRVSMSTGTCFVPCSNTTRNENQAFTGAKATLGGGTDVQVQRKPLTELLVWWNNL